MSVLKKIGFKALRFDQLSLVQKLIAIKNAKEIVTGAGSGYLFRNLVATNNTVNIITSDSYAWLDFSVCATGIGVGNVRFSVFEKEMSLACNFFPTCRNHASIYVTQDFLDSINGNIDWGESGILWQYLSAIQQTNSDTFSRVNIQA